MFIASKLLSFATQPLAWVVLLFAVALLCVPRKRALGLRLGWTSLGLLVVLGWQPLPDALLRALEAQHPPPAWTATTTAADWQRYAGVVVLGGALESAWVRAGNGQVALNDAAERMTVPVALLRQHPHLRLLFTGGEGDLLTSGEPEAVQARAFFESLGVPAQRMQFESRSRTTYENAIFTAALPGVDKTRPWLLVTSAWHMPRALATFRAAGWNVTPYPVDYRTGTRTPWTEYSLARACGAGRLRCMNGWACSPTGWRGARDPPSPERGFRAASLASPALPARSNMKRFFILLAILLSVAVAAPAGAAEKIGIVLMHGKLGASLGSVHGRQQIGGQLIAALEGAGYLVATPEMCWSRRRGFDLSYTTVSATSTRPSPSSRQKAPPPSSSAV